MSLFLSHAWSTCRAVICLVLGGAAAAVAQPSPQPRIVLVQPGLQFTVRDQSWNLFTARIENHGPEVLAALLFEYAGIESAQHVVWRRDVRLPAHSSRRVSFPVFMDAGPPVDASIRSLGMLRLTDRRHRVWDTEEVLGRASPRHRIHVLCIADPPVSSHFLDNLGPTAALSGSNRTVLGPRSVPGHAEAWAPFDVALVIASGDTRLAPASFEALLQWVRQGGVLVFSPGTGITGEAALDWGPHLPVLYASTATEASGLSGWPSGVASWSCSQGVAVHRMQALPGARVLAGAPEDPLAVGRAFDRGAIVALNFDVGAPTVQAWNGAADFLNRVIPWPSPLERYAGPRAEAGVDVDGLMANLSGIRVLSRRHAGQYLGGVAVLLAGILGLAHFGKRPERGWLHVSLLAPLMALGVILFADRYRGTPEAYLNELTMVRGHTGSSALGGQSLLALSAPRDSEYRVTGRAGAFLRPGVSFTRPPERFTVRVEDVPMLEPLLVRAHGMRRFAGQAPLTARAPGLGLRVGGDGIRLDWDGPLPADAEDLFVRWNRLVWLLGDMAAGEKTLPRGRVTRAAGEYTLGLLRRSTQIWRQHASDAWFGERPGTDRPFLPSVMRATPPLPPAVEWSRPRLCFWTRAPVFPIDCEPAVERRAMTFWSLRAPVIYGEDAWLYPKGVLDLEYAERTPGITETPSGGLRGLGAGRALAVFRLPRDAPDLEADELRVFVDFESETFENRVTLRPVRADAARKELDWRGGVAAVEDARDYYDRSARAVSVEVEIVRTGQTAGLSTAGWHIRELDIELTGRAP